MRLYLAVAVLVLALVACAEAQDRTIQDRFTEFGDQLSELGKTVAEKAKTTFSDIHNSEFASNTRNWFQEHLDKLKTKLGEITQ